MSLSGNLGFVSIDEVLRLLTRSHQQGAVAVTGMGLHGRVFVGKGGIDLATTSDNDELHRHLVNSGHSDEKSLNRIATGETTLAAIAEANAAIVELIREMTVESLHQIAARGEEFVVHEGATSPYASPKSFELEALLRDAEERKREWNSVSEVVPDLSGALVFRGDLGDREEVTVNADDWKVLSEIGAGSSVRAIADHLGSTEFWTARIAARLVKQELVMVQTSEDPAGEWGEDSFSDTSADEAAPTDEYSAHEAEKPHGEELTALGDAAPEHQPAAVEAEDDEFDQDPDGSWWQEPEVEDDRDDRDEHARTPEVVKEGLSEIPPVASREEDVEEGTEAFLEKVFSELESSDSDTDEGHGLLRRRRMGTLRDFSSDS